jgi:hypothetical protein
MEQGICRLFQGDRALKEVKPKAESLTESQQATIRF